jgi:hypothetical protein
MLSGSLASNFYGVPRATQDADLVLALFDLIDDPHDRERFSRRRAATVLGRRVSLPTAEDVIVSKLRWFRLAGRRKDWDDARNVMAVQHGVLDQPYLRHWCADLAILDLLETIERSLP